MSPTCLIGELFSRRKFNVVEMWSTDLLELCFYLWRLLDIWFVLSQLHPNSYSKNAICGDQENWVLLWTSPTQLWRYYTSWRFGRVIDVGGTVSIAFVRHRSLLTNMRWYSKHGCYCSDSLAQWIDAYHVYLSCQVGVDHYVPEIATNVTKCRLQADNIWHRIHSTNVLLPIFLVFFCTETQFYFFWGCQGVGVGFCLNFC